MTSGECSGITVELSHNFAIEIISTSLIQEFPFHPNSRLETQMSAVKMNNHQRQFKFKEVILCYLGFSFSLLCSVAFLCSKGLQSEKRSTRQREIPPSHTHAQKSLTSITYVHHYASCTHIHIYIIYVM